MQTKTMGDGLTGFWMRVDQTLHVRVVNGTMRKLLSAKSAATLTRILSPRLGHQILRAWMYRNGRWMLAENAPAPRGVFFGLYGLKSGSNKLAWGNNTTSPKWKARKAQAGTLQSTYSNQPFSRLAGLRDGSAFDTLKAFHLRRKSRQTP